MATAWTGVTAVLVAPLATTLSARVDPRKLVFAGIFWLGAITLWRTHATTDMTNWNISLPLLVTGLGMPFYFIPLTGLALASVKEEETASAVGLMNFLRTLSGAFATTLINTAWEGRTTTNHAELTGLADADGSLGHALLSSGMPADTVNATLDRLVTSQSVMLATNEIMVMVGIAFFIAAFAICLAPKPIREVDATAAGH